VVNIEQREEAFERTEEGREVVAGMVGLSAESTENLLLLVALSLFPPAEAAAAAARGGTETQTNGVRSTDQHRVRCPPTAHRREADGRR
jgi:hypothetical protein